MIATPRGTKVLSLAGYKSALHDDPIREDTMKEVTVARLRNEEEWEAWAAVARYFRGDI